MIQKHQAAKQQQHKVEQEEEFAKLKLVHEEQLKKILEDNTTAERELKEKHKAEQIELLAGQHKELRDHASDNWKQLESILQEFHADQLKMVEQQHSDQITLKQKQGKDGEEVVKLKQEHEEDKRQLYQKQEKERIQLRAQIEQLQQNLDQILTYQAKQLEVGIVPFTSTRRATMMDK